MMLIGGLGQNFFLFFGIGLFSRKPPTPPPSLITATIEIFLHLILMYALNNKCHQFYPHA